MAARGDPRRPAAAAVAAFGLAALLLLLAPTPSRAVEAGTIFEMHFQTKCIYQDLEEGELMTIDWWAWRKADEQPQKMMSVVVSDPDGKEIETERSTAQSEIIIHAVEDGDYSICFTAPGTFNLRSSRSTRAYRTSSSTPSLALACPPPDPTPTPIAFTPQTKRRRRRRT